MTLAMWSKIVGILAGALGGVSAAVTSQLWKTVISATSAAMMAISVVIASSTSAGHPDGEQTTKDQSAPFVSSK